MSHESIPGNYTEFDNEEEIKQYASMGSQTLIDTVAKEFDEGRAEIKKELEDRKGARKEAALSKPQEDLAAAEQKIIEVETIAGHKRNGTVKVKEWTSHRDRNAALEKINNYIDQEDDIDKELTQELADGEEIWVKLGGKAIEAAQLKVDQLNFKSNATDHVYAKAALRDAKDKFVENLRAELAAAQANADKAKAPAAADDEEDEPTPAPTPTPTPTPAAPVSNDSKDGEKSPEPIRTPDNSGEGSPDEEDSKERLHPKTYSIGEIAIAEFDKIDPATKEVIGKEFHHLQVAARTTDGKYVYLMDANGKISGQVSVDHLNEVREKAKDANYKEYFRKPEEVEKIKDNIRKVNLYTPVADGELEKVEWEIIGRNAGEAFISKRPENLIRGGVNGLWKEITKYEKAYEQAVINNIDAAGGLPRRQPQPAVRPPRGGERSQGGARPKTSGEWLKNGFRKFNEWDINTEQKLRDAINSQLGRSEKARDAKATLKRMRNDILSRVGGNTERNNVSTGTKNQIAKMLNNWLNSSDEHPGVRAGRALSRQSARRQRSRRR